MNIQNTGSKSAEELTKRYLDAVLKSQCSPNDNNSTKSEDEDMESEDIVVSMTPPTSPPPPVSMRSSSSVSRHSSSTAAAVAATAAAATTSALREKNVTLLASVSASSPKTNRTSSQDAPMDLSMKSTSSGGSSVKDASQNSDHRDMGSDEEGTVSSGEESNADKRPSSTESGDRSGIRNDEKHILEHSNGLRKGTTPLDLTTKI